MDKSKRHGLESKGEGRYERWERLDEGKAYQEGIYASGRKSPYGSRRRESSAGKWEVEDCG